MDSVRRKKIRLPESEYESGRYFVTICTEKRAKILANLEPLVGADDSVRPYGASPGVTISLTQIGETVKECLERLTNEEDGIFVDKYVIMPNHLHAVICLEGGMGGQSRPPLQRVIQRFKSITTRRVWTMGRKNLWQRSYYDHVVRDEADYLRIWQYIDENPARWAEDKYYSEQGDTP